MRMAQESHRNGDGMGLGTAQGCEWCWHGDGTGMRMTGIGWAKTRGWGWLSRAQASAGSWHSRHKPGDALGWALAPWAPAPSLPAGEELLEEGRLAALGQDFHLPGQGWRRDRDGLTSPVPAPGRPSPPAPTCVRGEWPIRAMTSSATFRAAWRSRSLALCPVDGDVRATLGWAPVPTPPSPSPGTFPDVDLPTGAVVQHEAVIGAEQALAEGAAGGHLAQVHAPRRIRHLPADGTSLQGHPGVPRLCPALRPPA